MTASSHPAPGVSLVGDLMIAQPMKPGVTERAALKRVVETFHETDSAIANLEMPLSRRGAKMLKHSSLRSDPDVIDDVRAMGIDAVSLANNHMMDYGPEALLDTVAVCERAGIAHAGAGANLAQALAPAWLDARGKRIALISVASTLPLGSEANETMVGIAPVRVYFSFEVDVNLINEQPGTVPTVHTWTRAEDQEAVCRLVSDTAVNADAVVVAIHWGVPSYWLSPYTGLLAEYQQPLGHALVDAGADVVFGHHAHALHGIEVYREKPIFYSAGNFIFETPRAFMEPESFVAQVWFGDRVAVELVPLMVDEQGFPQLAEGADAEHVALKLGRLSEPFGTLFERRGDRLEVVIG